MSFFGIIIRIQNLFFSVRTIPTFRVFLIYVSVESIAVTRREEITLVVI